jgi:hypothetical protein
VERVKDEFTGEGDSDSEAECDWMANAALEGSVVTDTEAQAVCKGGEGASADGGACGCRADAVSSALVEHGVLGGASGGKGQLTVFHSAAAEYLQNREYRGLERDVGEDAEMGIVPGQYGVAAGYAVHAAPANDA